MQHSLDQSQKFSVHQVSKLDCTIYGELMHSDIKPIDKLCFRLVISPCHELQPKSKRLWCYLTQSTPYEV